jgi:glycosyltransferase involved in cell wall biosynthesis|uniref:Glycosyltransferase n=1 Tax=Desulfobacca acetoxidans TaxID=60893 RepID=A0A7V6A6B0_9BACT
MHLYKSVTRFRPDKIASTVISLVPGGKIAHLLQSRGISVIDLGMRPGCPTLRAVFRLSGVLRSLRPHIVQTYLYHADLLGYVAARWAEVPNILWNLRQSLMDFSRYRRTTALTVRLCARFSRRVKYILVNSYAGLKAHARLGYDAARMLVVPNGFELSRFRPHPPSYREVRQELGLGPETRLVGMLARFDPQKDHETFLRAAQLVSKRLPEAFFLLAGNGINHNNPAFARLLAANPINPERLIPLGERSDTPRLLAALDVYVSSSAFGEGFPNAIGEAMACGVPCVVTDVGDSASIVGETGVVVQPGQPHDLARAIKEVLGWPPTGRASRGAAARVRIEQNFDINQIAARLESFYLDLAARSDVPGLMEPCQLSA